MRKKHLFSLEEQLDLMSLWSQGVKFPTLIEAMVEKGHPRRLKQALHKKIRELGGERRYYYYTADEEAKLIALRAQGLSYGKIGKEMGRTRAAVNHHMLVMRKSGRA